MGMMMVGMFMVMVLIFVMTIWMMVVISFPQLWAFNLVASEMKPLYDAAYGKDPEDWQEFGWKEKDKKEELWADEAWYLLARTQEGVAVAFAHFRYDMDYDDEVVYCYEIQVEAAYRRKGLGRFMMKLLEMLCLKADMLKLMTTIFREDPRQAGFFKKALKFETDETSLEDTVDQQFAYEILCR